MILNNVLESSIKLVIIYSIKIIPNVKFITMSEIYRRYICNLKYYLNSFHQQVHAEVHNRDSFPF